MAIVNSVEFFTLSINHSSIDEEIVILFFCSNLMFCSIQYDVVTKTINNGVRRQDCSRVNIETLILVTEYIHQPEENWWNMLIKPLRYVNITGTILLLETNKKK